MRHKRILLLAAVHLATGLGGAIFGPNLVRPGGLPYAIGMTLTVGFVGLWAAQATLVGFVGGLGPASWRKRLAAMATGCFYLGLVPMVADGSWNNGEEAFVFACWAVIPSAAIAGLLCWVRSRWACVQRIAAEDASASEPMEGLRFTTRHLLILTGIVAVLFAGGRIAQSMGNDPSTIAMMALITPMFAACGVAIGAATLWAGLGLRAPIMRAAAVLLLAAALGAVPASYFGDNAVWWRWLTWPGVLAAQAAIVIVSLWVVRSCGYRLVQVTSKGRRIFNESASSTSCATAGRGAS